VDTPGRLRRNVLVVHALYSRAQPLDV
jgi:hypothetical protein